MSLRKALNGNASMASVFWQMISLSVRFITISWSEVGCRPCTALLELVRDKSDPSYHERLKKIVRNRFFSQYDCNSIWLKKYARMAQTYPELTLWVKKNRSPSLSSLNWSHIIWLKVCPIKPPNLKKKTEIFWSFFLKHQWWSFYTYLPDNGVSAKPAGKISMSSGSL